ncbi:MAG: hypothetical protein IKI58_04440 [Oscillospiraceae bacterium]|nr:hypothetical protein [Oscillospiraceae bacterium]
MSWSNPTPEEAQEYYDSAVSRYNTAAEDYYAAKSEYENAYDVWKSTKNVLEGVYDSERRLNELKERMCQAIKELSDGDYADRKIEEANSVAKYTWEALDGCVSCSGVNFPRSFLIFNTDRVPSNSHSARAVELFKAERDDLEAQIQETRRIEQNWISYIEEQEAKMRNCMNVMTDTRKTMDATTLDMEHYGKYIEE